VKLPLLFLMGTAEPWLTQARMAEIKTFADSIGPAKNLIAANPAIVSWAHAAGLSVTPYTFRSTGQPAGRTVREEIDQFLYTFGVDALFTDNPDQFPRR
jgi:glycerophosphoryl diester phosphodiesterase